MYLTLADPTTTPDRTTPAQPIWRRLRHRHQDRVRPVDLLWVLFAVTMIAVMVFVPDEQTIPYHFTFVSFTLLYGYRLWSPKVTVGVLLLLTVIPGLMFVHLYLTGAIAVSELAEVPLMPLIVGGMAWHAHRSATARRLVEELAALESSRLERQREFLRDAAHAIRTPITIARGHVELIQVESDDPQVRADTDEVLHQLDRMQALARRLLVIEALRTTEPAAADRVDLMDLVGKCGRRWSSTVPRSWAVQAGTHGFAMTDALRFEEALDALVENALRFTTDADTVRIGCRVEGEWICLEVADSGPGIPAEDRERVFDRFFHRHPLGEEPGTGLGLALVAAVAEAFGGEVEAAAAPEGGALVSLRLPRS